MQEAIELTLKLLGSKLKAMTLLHDGNGEHRVWFNPSELNQVLVNILMNAIQACEEVGDRPSEIHISLKASDGEIRLNIDDNGCGMSEETQARMCDPFFSTKPVGTSTGIGMAMVLQILKKHNDHIQLIWQF